MKQYTTSLLLFLLSAFAMHAQELKVKSMQVAQGDLSASTQPRQDLQKNPCGLVKVQLAAAGAKFDGNVIGEAEYKTGEYWVYMTQGSYMLQVKHPNFLPLMVNFRDHGIRGVEAKTTYVLTLLMPQGSQVNVDDGMRYLAMTVEPAQGATVYIDGENKALKDGALNLLLPMGQHTYRVEAQGYVTKTGTFTLTDDKLTLPVKLESAMATLHVSCATAAAKIYVNDQMKGTSPWSGTLSAGSYRVEARLDGYRSQRQSITLGERANETVALPALMAITGNMNVNYLPQNAEVWLDGKKLGTSPDVFRNILIGQHQVEIRKDGYETKHETVTIAEGQTAIITGSLSTATQPVPEASAGASSAAIETITVKGVSFNMVRVEGGTFQMGATDEMKDPDSDEKPVHRVTLSSYSIGEMEVTQEIWEAVMGSNPSRFKGAKLPVENVSWDDCQEFIRKLNALTGRTFRLPTEAEWEFAARGGNKSRGHQYSGNGNLDEVAWYDGNSGSKTHDVGTKQPNELGLYDMSGNVWEWCQDWYSDYGSDAQTNPKGPSSGSSRVGRSGSWFDYARDCRSSLRRNSSPSYRGSDLGLRLAL